MAVVMIIAESYCGREKVAQEVAQALGYECVGREELISETKQRYDAPEAKRQVVLGRSAPLLRAFSNKQNRRLACFQATLTAALKGNNVVYHGQVAHLLIEGVSHILKARLLSDLEKRAQKKASAEEISERRAVEDLQKEKEKLMKWTASVFDVDPAVPHLFDLVLDVDQLGMEGAVGAITDCAREVRFQPVTYSIKCMEDAELASRIRAELIDSYPDVTVQANDGDVRISAKALGKEKKARIRALNDWILEMNGVSYVEIV